MLIWTLTFGSCVDMNFVTALSGMRVDVDRVSRDITHSPSTLIDDNSRVDVDLICVLTWMTFVWLHEHCTSGVNLIVDPVRC